MQVSLGFVLLGVAVVGIGCMHALLAGDACRARVATPGAERGSAAGPGDHRMAMTGRRRSRQRAWGAGRSSDRDLLTDALAGDRHAFVTILKRHDARLRRLAARLLGGQRHRVDDVLQDAYVKAFVALPGFRGEADVGTWLYRITYHACIDEIRRTGRRPQPVDTHDTTWDRPASASGPDAVVSAVDDVERALDALPTEQRGALVLVVGEGFDLETAARILGVPIGTVASRVSRARAAARRVLAEDDAR